MTLGAGNLSIYRDAATLDNGPGYLNGILSLWLNSESSGQREMNSEEIKATPYFHRAKAAELLAILLLTRNILRPAERPGLHAALIRALCELRRRCQRDEARRRTVPHRLSACE